MAAGSRDGPRGRRPHLCSGFAHADLTWTYSFSGAFLFVMGFVVAGLCYLSYRYVTKPPPPPKSLVSSPPWARRAGLGAQPQRAEARGPLARPEMQETRPPVSPPT